MKELLSCIKTVKDNCKIFCSSYSQKMYKVKIFWYSWFQPKITFTIVEDWNCRIQESANNLILRLKQLYFPARWRDIQTNCHSLNRRVTSKSMAPKFKLKKNNALITSSSNYLPLKMKGYGFKLIFHRNFFPSKFLIVSTWHLNRAIAASLIEALILQWTPLAVIFLGNN